MNYLPLILLLLLTGCMSAPSPQPQVPNRPQVTKPPPITERSTPETAPPASPVVPPQPTPPPSSEATQALVKASQEATLRGDHRNAIASLERAIRIDGRNADLWARLSVAYLRDGRVNPARQYANRATALAGNRPDWKRSAWLAVAAIEEQAGNHDEAERIRALYSPENR